MRGIQIGSIFGIPIRLGLSFLLVLPLFAYLIGLQIEATAELVNALAPVSGLVDPAAIADGNTQWVVGFVAAVGLFVGVLLHELGHSVTAMRYGYGIESITLWLFGGIASLTEMPEDWRQEFVIAIMGPVVSVAVGVVCYATLFVVPLGDGATLNGARFVLGYLAVLNVTLAVFNMLPGFPMDGGRVLRALLARTRPYARATQIAATVGKGFAALLAVVGLLTPNILLVGLAFFIYIGASSEAQQTMLKAAFEGVTVGDIMTPAGDLDTVTANSSVADLVARMIQERHTGYPVMENGRLAGLVTLDDARSVAEVERDAVQVRDVMSSNLTTVTPTTDAMTAITLMSEAGVGRLPVVDADGQLVGLISRSDLMTSFEIIRQSQNVKPREGVGRIGGPGASEPGTRGN
jgi:Zn-dependent protease/CBS domain-containing protein